MTYGEAYFQPMVSLVRYLYEHDYTVYIVSATYRDAVRVMTEGVLDAYIPYDHVIGTDLLYVASGDEDENSMFYELKPEDELVIAGELFIKNQKTNKATVIRQEIGKMPVLAFGNSTGDFSMATYTLQNEKYGGRAYMLLCDDTERDYGDPEAAAAFKAKCDANGFYTVSMKDEFASLYPEGVHMAEAAGISGELIGTAENRPVNDEIPGWSADSPAMASIVAYVESVTDEKSPEYVPPEERIVLFDSDGTLIGERYPTYSDQCMLLRRLLHDDSAGNSNPEDVAFAEALEAAIQNYEPLPDSPRSTAQMAAESFQGFTVEEYRAYVREFLQQSVPGFTGMTYGGRFFVPMVELVRYLAERDFQVFICSGTERIFLRELIAGTLDEYIPPYRVIGSTFSLTATGQGDTADRSYTYTSDDQVLLGGDMIFKNLKMGKVISIVNEIGTMPILAFGNSSGDFAMGQYALQHGGRAYMLLCDDTERDYGDTEEAADFAQKCDALGFETISMRDEFEIIPSCTVLKSFA